MVKFMKLFLQGILCAIIVIFFGVITSVCISGMGTPAVYAAEAPAAIFIGETYTYSDEGGEYSVYIESESEYKLTAINGEDGITLEGSYKYIDGVLTLNAAGETLGDFYIQGSNLVKIVPSEPVEEVNYTFIGRVGEWVYGNLDKILTAAGDIVLVVLFIVQRVNSKKKLVELGANVLTVKDDVSNTMSSQKSVVAVTNELIAGYNRFEQALNNFDSMEEERYKTMLSAYAQTKATLEILTTVYANSKNIPQGVKDLVNLKYADALKTVGDKDKLKEIAESSSVSEPAESSTETKTEE